MDSVMVPIWLTLSKRPLQAFFSMALSNRRRVSEILVSSCRKQGRTSGCEGGW